MHPVNTVVIEWAYSPSDFLEDIPSLTLGDHTVAFNGGAALVTLPLTAYQDNNTVREQLTAALQDVFEAVQAVRSEPYTLKGPSVICTDSEGRRGVTIVAESAVARTTAFPPDILIHDAAGNVIMDTKQERHDRIRRMAELAQKHRQTDAPARAILSSYGAARRDPANALVHLYEIREALATHFGGEKAALTSLRVSRAKWKQFGALANDEPVMQGRHRGTHVGALRSATAEELEFAQAFARELIYAYLESLAVQP